MFPILFKLGSLEFYSYGLMMALGVLAGMQAVLAEARRYGWNQDDMSKLSVWTFLMGLLGSRVVYILTRLGDPYVDTWELIFNVRAGFVFYGGFIASWLFLIWYVRRKKLPFWAVLDTFCLGICIGLAMGRVGCFLGGCCYGVPTTLPWGAVMKGESHLGPLHPVQLYEFLFLVAFFAFLWWRRKRKAFEGEILALFIGGYAIARYALEFWRGDKIRGFLIDSILSTSQAISIPMLVIAALLYGYHLRKRKKNHATSRASSE